MDRQTDGQTDGQNHSGYYSGLHCEQCGCAVKIIHFQMYLLGCIVSPAIKLKHYESTIPWGPFSDEVPLNLLKL